MSILATLPLLFGLWLGSDWAAGAELNFDVEDEAALEFALNDNPYGFQEPMKNLLQSLNPERDGLAWIRVLRFLAALETEGNILESLPHLKKAMQEGISLAKQRGFERDWVFLQIYSIQIDLEKNAAPLTQISEAYKQLLVQAQTLKNPQLSIPILTAYATQLLYGNDLATAIQVIAKADELAEHKAPIPFFDLINLKNVKALLLNYQRRVDASVGVIKEILQLLDEHKVRRLASMHNQNLAISLLYSGDRGKRDEGFELAKKALVQSHELKDINNEASSLMHIAKYYSAIANFEQADKFSLRAVQLVNAEHDKYMIGYMNWMRATVLINAKKWKEALEAADRAIENYPTEDINNRKNILLIRYKAFKGLKRYDKALDAMEEYQRVFEKISEQKENEQYNRASAKLGLQLEEEKNRNLQKEKELQAQKLEQKNKESELFRRFAMILAALSACTVALLIRSLIQAKKLKYSKSQIQLILDTIDEGLLIVGRDHRINRNYSRYLKQIVGMETPIEDRDFIETIFSRSKLPAERQSIIREVMGVTLGENRLAWDVNAANLPAEYISGEQNERIVAIRWMPIFDHRDEMQRLLVSLADVTKERALEAAVGDQRKHLQALPETLRELLQGKSELIDQLFDRTEGILESLLKENPSREILGELHTQKGAARTLGLRSLSESLHELETKIKNSGNEASSTLLQSEQIKRIRENLAEYRSYALVLRQSQSSQSANACSLLSTAIEPFVAIWIQQMDEVGLPIEEVRILDSFLRWTPQSIHLIRDLCLHAVNNSLDHGFVFPFRKGEKVDRPTLEIAAKQQNHELKLEIRDNGVGLNMEKLREMALAKGFSLSAQESISDVLFMDGVSTAQEVTLTSGRGMGLSAIQSVVRRNGGSVKIANREGSRGTVVSISLPLQDQRYILEAI